LSAPPLGVYVHWPYCARVCPYCDFAVVRERGRVAEQAGLLRTVLEDLAANAALTGPRRLASIFLGGGTPSLLAPEQVAAIVAAARDLWDADPDLEVTLEANPTDAEAARFAGFAEAGVDRLSLGVQSLRDETLRFLGRNHDVAAARRATACALATFPRVSLDLIYAVPGQSPAAWADELREAIALGAEHISPYQLTIETGTAFERATRRGILRPPPADLGADLYDVTQSLLVGAGFESYEISNHARGAVARSRHNLIYWRGHDYVGVGPGAHGRLTLADGRFATAAPRDIADYVTRVRQTGGGAALERLDAREIALERLLMGLRTDEGVDLTDLAALDIPPSRWPDLDRWVRLAGGRARLTAVGRPLLDRIAAELAG
jgi:oxygen-independent coproporphyrinogen-3 oxidase